MWKWKEIRQKKKKQWEIITIWKMRHRRKIHLSWLKNGYDYDLLLLYKRCAKTQVHAFLANRSHLFSFINEIVPFQLKLTHAAWGSGGGGGVRRPHPEEEKKPKLIKYLDAANEFRVHGIIVQWWLLVATRFALSFARESTSHSDGSRSDKQTW